MEYMKSCLIQGIIFYTLSFFCLSADQRIVRKHANVQSLGSLSIPSISSNSSKVRRYLIDICLPHNLPNRVDKHVPAFWKFIFFEHVRSVLNQTPNLECIANKILQKRKIANFSTQFAFSNSKPREKMWWNASPIFWHLWDLI